MRMKKENCALAALILGSVCFLIGLESPAHAEPKIKQMDQRWMKLGAANQVTFRGTDIAKDSKVLFEFPIASQKVTKVGNGFVTLEIVLGEDIPTGIHAGRLANSTGISVPFVVSIDRIETVAFGPKIESLPIALSGTYAGPQRLTTVFSAKKSETVSVEVEGRRLGSLVRPLIRVYDARGAQVAWSQPNQTIAGDSRLSFVAPRDGEYTIELHDMLSKGQRPGYFRLRVGNFSFADITFPIGVSTKKTNKVSSLANGGKPLEWFHVNTQSGTWAAGDATQKNFAGTRPRLMVSTNDEYLESELKKGQVIESIPCGVNGAILERGERDTYSFKVTKGQKLRFELFGRRVGSKVDAVLTLKNKAGNQLGRNDDRPGIADSQLDYSVPDGIDQVNLTVEDLARNYGPNSVYRVSVTDLNQPNFALSIPTHSLNIPKNGTLAIPVNLERINYQGAVELSLVGLPKGIKSSGTTIWPGSKKAWVSLENQTGQSFDAGTIQLTGKSDAGLVKFAMTPDLSTTKMLPWEREQIGIALSQPSPIAINWAESGELWAGGELRSKLKITGEKAIGPIRIRLETSQTIPKKKIRENNKDKIVTDVDRTLRLAKPIELANLNSPESPLQIAIPNDLPDGKWGLMMVAELLSPDKKRVLASSFSPVTYLASRRVLDLKITSPRSIKIDPKNPAKLTGEIKRLSSEESPVEVQLINLPMGVEVPKTMVPAGQSKFELNVQLPPSVKQDQLKNVKVIASLLSQSDPQHIIAKSKDIKISVTVPAPPAPAKEKAKK